MKIGCTMLLMCMSLYITAQTEKIETTVVKTENLITFAADYESSDDEQSLYLLVETGTAGITQNSKFYIEQGVQLLLKRLQEGDKIAIGTYGSVNALVLPYTRIEDKEAVTDGINSLLMGTFEASEHDGVAIAYDLAEAKNKDDILANIIMLRGASKNDTPILATNAYGNTVKTLEPSQAESPSEIVNTKEEDRKEKRSQRQQAKAASHNNLGGAIALTALTILPEILDIIKD